MNHDDEEACRYRRETYYDKMCWCGHAMGNHTLVTGECMLCDHTIKAREIHEYNERIARNIANAGRR